MPTLLPAAGGQAGAARVLGKPKATRHYTGAALERRQAWGREWGAVNRYNAQKLRGESQ